MSAFKLALCLIADKHNAPADVMTIIGKDVARHQAFNGVLNELKDASEGEQSVLTPHPYYSDTDLLLGGVLQNTQTQSLLRDALRVEHGGCDFWDYAVDRGDLCDEDGCLEYMSSDGYGANESILWRWSHYEYMDEAWHA